jgi:hypothetical protein
MGILPAVFLAAQFMTTLPAGAAAAFDAYAERVEGEYRARAAGKGPAAGKSMGVTAHAAGKDFHHAMLHDWSASALLAGVKKEQAVAVIEGFDRHKDLYAEVIDSKLLGREGGRLRGMHVLRKKKVIEVTMEARYEVELLPAPAHRYASSGVSTQIVELEHPGTAKEKRLSPGYDHGFLWKLRTFWLLEETPAGLWMEVRSVSLTRDTPLGLGWAIRPIVKELPKESLEALLEQTRRAVAGGS